MKNTTLAIALFMIMFSPTSDDTTNIATAIVKYLTK